MALRSIRGTLTTQSQGIIDTCCWVLGLSVCLVTSIVKSTSLVHYVRCGTTNMAAATYVDRKKGGSVKTFLGRMETTEKANFGHFESERGTERNADATWRSFCPDYSDF